MQGLNCVTTATLDIHVLYSTEELHAALVSQVCMSLRFGHLCHSGTEGSSVHWLQELNFAEAKRSHVFLLEFDE